MRPASECLFRETAAQDPVRAIAAELLNKPKTKLSRLSQGARTAAW